MVGTRQQKKVYGVRLRCFEKKQDKSCFYPHKVERRVLGAGMLANDGMSSKHRTGIIQSYT